MKNSALPPEVQTDKKATKECTCLFPDCGRRLIVNTFYAPAKGRCKEHTGSAPTQIRAAASVATVTADTKPNRALADIRCPFCDSMLRLKTVDESRLADDTGFLQFECRNIKECGSAFIMRVKFGWSAMMIYPKPPLAWQPFVEEFNAARARLAQDELNPVKVS